MDRVEDQVVLKKTFSGLNLGREMIPKTIFWTVVATVAA
jgi:hypothetical protein